MKLIGEMILIMKKEDLILNDKRFKILLVIILTKLKIMFNKVN